MWSGVVGRSGRAGNRDLRWKWFHYPLLQRGSPSKGDVVEDQKKGRANYGKTQTTITLGTDKVDRVSRIPS